MPRVTDKGSRILVWCTRLFVLVIGHFLGDNRKTREFDLLFVQIHGFFDIKS